MLMISHMQKIKKNCPWNYKLCKLFLQKRPETCGTYRSQSKKIFVLILTLGGFQLKQIIFPLFFIKLGFQAATCFMIELATYY